MPWKPAYITYPQLATAVRADSVARKEDLEDACEAASRTVDKAANRQFGSATGTRLYEPIWSASNGMWQVDTDDFEADQLTAVAYDSAGDYTYATAMDIASLLPYPFNASQDGRPYEGFYVRRTSLARPARFRVTADPWGWSAVPRTVIAATKLQAVRFFARYDAPFGVAGSPSDGSEVRLLARADADVIVMLKSRQLVRRTWAR
jgi:hypothetical protein